MRITDPYDYKSPSEQGAHLDCSFNQVQLIIVTELKSFKAYLHLHSVVISVSTSLPFDLLCAESINHVPITN